MRAIIGSSMNCVHECSIKSFFHFLFFFHIFALLGYASEAVPLQPVLLPSSLVQLSSEEREWIARNPVVRVGMDPSWAPFSFKDQSGVYHGIDPELLEILLGRLGLKAEYVKSNNWSQVWDLTQKGYVDLVSGLAQNEKRKEYVRFTSPYLYFPSAIVVRDEAPFFLTIDHLFGKKIAMPNDYAATTYLRDHFPEIRVDLVENMEQSLDLVSRGTRDATVMNIAVVSHLIQRKGLSNLKIAGFMMQRFDLHYGIEKKNEMLYRLVSRSLATMTEREMAPIIKRWTIQDYRPLNFWTLYYPWIFLGSVLVTLFIAWFVYQNRKLRRLIEERIEIGQEVDVNIVKLQRMSEEKTKILHSVIHDLRNPVGSLRLNNWLAKKSLEKEESRSVEESFQISMEILKGMEHLVENILTISTIEEGVRKPKVKKIHLKEFYHDLLEFHRIQADQKSIHLTLEFVSLESSLSEFIGDPTMLRQIFDNLLSNAIKFTPRDLSVAVVVERKENLLRISVKDQGPGLDEEDQKKLFQKFAKLKPTSEGFSSGLGLSIVKGLVDELGGKISCESVLLKGTNFIVEIPER